MKKIMKNALLIGCFLGMLLPGISLQAATPGPGGATKVETVIIDLITIGLSWTPMTGNTPYQVNVMDLTTSQMHTQTSTYQTSVTLNPLTEGHRYLFSVSRGAQTEYIIIDIIDL